VPSDPRRAEVVGEQPRVRVGGAVQDGDPMRCGVAQVGHHPADDRAYLVVGVRGGDHLTRCDVLLHRADVGPARNPVEQGLCAGLKIVEQEGHHRGREVAGDPTEVDHVVPVRGEQGSDAAVQADQVGADPAGGADRVQPGFVHLAELRVGGGKRADRRRVLGHRPEVPGILLQGAPPGGGEHRPGRRAASAAGQRGRAESLGQPIHGEHVQHGDTRPAADAVRQRPADVYAGQIRPDQHRDGRQRIVPLQRGDGGAQRAVRGPPDARPVRRHRFDARVQRL
jgi:hypothetical protein